VGETRHKVTLEVNADTRKAQQAIQGVERSLDRAADAAGKALGGGGSAGGGRAGQAGRGGIGTAMMAGAGYLAGHLASNPYGAVAGGALLAGSYGANKLADRVGGAGGTALRGLGGILGLAGGLIPNAIATGYQNAVNRASVQKNIANAQVAGLSGAGMGAIGTQFGLTPGESSAMQLQFARSRGMVGASDIGMGGMNPLHLAGFSGASMGAIAGYAGSMGAGGGGKNGDAQAALRQAFSQGLRGSSLDRWLATIAGATSQMASQGLKMDLDAFNRATGRMENTPGLAGMGTLQPQLAARATGLAGQGRAGLLAGFGSLSEAYMLRNAARLGGPGFGGLMQGYERMMTDPNLALGAYAGTGSAGQFAAMASLGIGSDAARGVVNLSGSEASAGKSARFTGANYGLSTTIAAAEWSKINSASDKQWGDVVVAEAGVNRAMTALGAASVDAVNKLADAIRSGKLSDFVSTIAVDAVKDTVGSVRDSIKSGFDTVIDAVKGAVH
jgi:hypothetical protein